MKILAFVVSSNMISVAISEGEEILAYIEDTSPSSQAERLVPIIEQALLNARISYDDIEYLAVTNGPGSFTGIRVGLACAKGILFDSNIESTAVNNFEIYYYRAISQVQNWDKIIVILNAYRGQLYVKFYDKILPAAESKPLLLTYTEVANLLKADYLSQIICVGNGLHIIAHDIKNLTNVTLLPRFPKIKALHICRYIYENLHIRKPLPMEPLYIRLPDAHYLPLKNCSYKIAETTLLLK